MVKKIYVGNLPFSTSEEQVKELFEQYGAVHSIKLLTDRDTGRLRGFGFVEMAPGEADAAIEGLNGKDLEGRNLRVNEAKDRDRGPRQPRRRRW